MLFADWAPRLSDEQIEEIYYKINLNSRSRGDISGKSLLEMPFEPKTVRALQNYVAKLEKFMGRRAGYFVLRTDVAVQVRGHRHEGHFSIATASISLIGAGTYVRIGPEQYETPTGKTVLFHDGDDGIFHGAPYTSGRRIFFGIAFLYD